MTAVIVDVARDAGKGVFDSIAGLLFILELDQDVEPIVEVQPQRQTVRTVLKDRRERDGRAVPSRQVDVVAPRVRAWKRVAQCMTLNVGCAVLLHGIMLPVLSFIAHLSFSQESADNISDVMSYAGVLPIFIFSRIANALWFSDIAGACTRALRLPEPLPVDFRRAASDFIVSVVLEIIFLLQSGLVRHLPIPVVAPLLSFIHLSLLHSLYSFEYFWMSRSVLLHDRVQRMERHWPYFVGFGAPLTLASWMSSNFVVSGCSFGALFPLFIISSYKAQSLRRFQLPLSESVTPLRIFMPSKLVTDRVATYVSTWMLGF